MTKTACVFPGQGSQSVGMLKELADSYPQIEATFKEASDVLGSAAVPYDRHARDPCARTGGQDDQQLDTPHSV